MAKNAPAIMDDSLSADSYLNVLYMPSTFPRSERSRRLLESDGKSYISEYDDGPHSNLDGNRYLECVTYLQEVCEFLCYLSLHASMYFISLMVVILI